MGDARPRRTGIVAAGWPEFDEAVAKAEEIVVPVQVNGKLRARLTVPADITEDASCGSSRSPIRRSPGTSRGKTVKKVVVAGGRLVSIVVA